MKLQLTSLLLIALFVISGCQPKELPSILTIQGDHIVCKVSHMTTKTEMDDFTRKLAAINVRLDLTGTTYLKDGKLQNLQFVVSLPNGMIGTAATDIVGLQYRYYGFEYNPRGNPSFKTGSFE